MTDQQQLLTRLSLSFLWIFTGINSTFFGIDAGYDVLSKGGITGGLASSLIYLGSGVDILIGIWLLFGKEIRICCMVQIVVIVTYSLILTYFDASYWLHPFGPITKNIPIIVLVYLLCSSRGYTKANG